MVNSVEPIVEAAGSRAEIQTPEAWQRLAKQIASDPGVVLLIGASDAGKTTLGTFLLKAWGQMRIRVAFVDGDIGQSTLGPPTTIGLALFPPSGGIPPPPSPQPEPETITPLALRFVGSTSPAGHFLPLLVGLKRLVEKACELDARIILVDTTGLVHGAGGRELKFQKIDLLSPRHLVALQRKGELESLLLPHRQRPGLLIHRLAVVEGVINRSRDGRRAYRERKFQEYFQNAHPLQVSLKEAWLHGFWFRGGRRLLTNELNFLAKSLNATVLYGELGPDSLDLLVSGGASGDFFRVKAAFGVSDIRMTNLDDLRGLLLGLNNASNDTLALGILQELDLRRETLLCLTPLADPKLPKLIQFGSLRIEPSGKELGSFPLERGRSSVSSAPE